MELVEEMAEAMYEAERSETGVGRPWARLMTSKGSLDAPRRGCMQCHKATLALRRY